MCILCDLTGRDLHNARTINENIDAVASTRTSYTLSVGDVFNGDLDTFGDRDWVEIILSEGFQYKVDLTGSPSGDGTLEDPYLRIYDSGGNLLLENDDIEDGVNRESSIVATASYSGSYFLSAGSFNDDYLGSYQLETMQLDEGIDAVASTATSYTLSVDHVFNGNLDTFGDRDWVEIILSEGLQYRVDLTGSPSGDGTLEDPYLRIYDSGGNLLFENDDIDDGVDRESRIVATAPYSGSYFLSAGSFNDDYLGSYRLETMQLTSDDQRNFSEFAPNTSISTSTWSGINSDNDYINGLMWRSGCKWGSADPETTTTELKYYIYDNENTLGDYTAGSLKNEEEQAYLDAMGAFSSVANITFTEGDSALNSHILWASLDDNESEGYLGFAAPPDVENSSTRKNGDPIGLTTQNWEYYSSFTEVHDSNALIPGSYYFLTTIHELGHSLGLSHPHDNSALFPGVTRNDDSDGGDNGLNAAPYTVMTYNDVDANKYVPYSQEYYGYLETLGAFDIAAVQYLYGPNKNANSGDDTYELTGRLNGYQCIWDVGGKDTIDATNADGATTIDLRNATLNNEFGGGGFVSRINNDYGGYTIAYETSSNSISCIIENAKGSIYKDVIRGNSSANTLNGDNGNDTLNGGLGNDRLVGGSGIDTAVFGSRNNRINLASKRRQNTGDGRDILTGIENVNGGGGNDIITGTRSANTLNGENGNDILYGDLGNDRLVGGSGIDTAVFSSRNNHINLASKRRQNTGDGRDILTGIENVNGGGGNDIITGTRSANTLNGGDGNDTLNGGNGNDRLAGGEGNDTLNGGKGNDTLEGGLGYDIFQINSGVGRDLIVDYEDGGDRIKLLGGLTEDSLNLRNIGGHTKISNDDDLLAIVQNTIADDITFI